MKITTYWDAWRIAEHQYNTALDLANKSAGASHEVKYYTEIAKRRERQAIKFVDVIIDFIFTHRECRLR